MITKFKIFERVKQLKFKIGDFAKYYNKPIKILNVIPTSKFPYFIEYVYSERAIVVKEKELEELTPEEQNEIVLYLAQKKYNL